MLHTLVPIVTLVSIPLILLIAQYLISHFKRIQVRVAVDVIALWWVSRRPLYSVRLRSLRYEVLQGRCQQSLPYQGSSLCGGVAMRARVVVCRG